MRFNFIVVIWASAPFEKLFQFWILLPDNDLFFVFFHFSRTKFWNLNWLISCFDNVINDPLLGFVAHQIKNAFKMWSFLIDVNHSVWASIASKCINFSRDKKFGLRLGIILLFWFNSFIGRAFSLHLEVWSKYWSWFLF